MNRATDAGSASHPPLPASPFTALGDGVRVAVRVAPQAAANRIAGVAAGAAGPPVLKVSVTAAARDGKANAALIKLLAKAWRLPKRTIKITAGARARRKVLHVAGEPGALLGRMRSWAGGSRG